MKKCPYCAEMIQDEAIKCRYCGSDLDKDLDFGQMQKHATAKEALDDLMRQTTKPKRATSPQQEKNQIPYEKAPTAPSPQPTPKPTQDTAKSTTNISVGMAILISLGLLIGSVIIGAIFQTNAAILLMVFISAIWAASDASKIGLSKYKTSFVGGPTSLFFGVWFLWIVGFPWYLWFRSKILNGSAELKAEDKISAGSKNLGKLPMGITKGKVEGIIITAIFIFGFMAWFSNHKNTNSGSQNQTETSQPKLELLSWNWHEESGFAIVEGEVKNISSKNLENVEAVASFRTESGGFITSSDALIELNPILPGQTSPFKVMATWNPEMKKADIKFKYLIGGEIETKLSYK